MHGRALVVEGSASARTALARTLAEAGLDSAEEADGRRGLTRFGAEPFDLVVLEVDLPVVNGFTVCSEIRRTSAVPIVFVSARATTSDLVTGLDLGADDYVVKPYIPEELRARITAVMRRASPHRHIDAGRLVAGDLVLEPGAFLAELAGAPLSLTATEFRLLLELVRHQGETLSREALLREVWGYDFLGHSRLVDMAVGRLRDKLGDDPRTPRYVVTVRGVGYRFGPVDASAPPALVRPDAQGV